MGAKYYTYIFTRQDISPEQQLVQSAHAAYALGRKAQDICEDTNKVLICPHETYFTVIGVRNQEALFAVQEILSKFSFEYVNFIEPDMEDELTSIAVYNVAEGDRGPLLAFDLLKINGKG